MASTPEVGPSPTTRTNTSAQTSSGMLRRIASSRRTPWRSQNGPAAMRPESAEMDRPLEASSASGTASSRPRKTPVVAIATVRQLSWATSVRKSRSCAGGQKSARKRPLSCRLSGCQSSQGRNSVATSSGHSSTGSASRSATRPGQAGSRCRGCAGRAALSIAAPSRGWRQALPALPVRAIPARAARRAGPAARA